MLNLFHVGKPLDQLIVARTQEIHDLVFLACGFDANDDLIPGFPFFDELRDHFHRVLKIRCQQHRTVPRRLEHAVIGRIELPEIFRVEDGFDVRIACTESGKLFPGMVGGTVVDKDKLVPIGGQLFPKGFADGVAEGYYIFLFVITWN